jgi:glycosyltransferase involved in cell wall biosynthesis
MNKNLQIELGCPEDKIIIIPNGVDYEKFSTLPRRYEKSQPEFNIGVVARVVPIKDIKTMLYAFEYVKEKLEGANLIILGPYDEDKNYYEECLALINELGIKDVFFHGNVSIQEFLPRFDIMLLTSISEGQPLAVLEGMAAGIPQVCTNVGSCKELLFGRKEDNLGRAGLIVPMMKPEDIAQAMVYLSKNPGARKEMGIIGAERVKKYYQKSIFLEQYHDLYLNQL